jgi:NitT/TauT family transport system permease protein
MAEQAAGRLKMVTSIPRTKARGRLLQRLIVPLVMVVCWELFTRADWIDSRFIPTPSKVIQSWYLWIFGSRSQTIDPYYGTWVMHALASTERVMTGFAIAAVLGVIFGILIGRFVVCRTLFDTVIQIMRPIPTSAWVPFAVVFFGFKTPASIFLIALGSFFPIVVNTTDGVRMVPSIYYRAAAMLGTSPLRVLWRIVLPAALPSIFTGLRLGIGVSWVLVIVSEMIAVRSGLGYVLWDAYYYARMDMIVAAMLTVGILGMLSDRIVVVIGNRLLRWHEGEL